MKPAPITICLTYFRSLTLANLTAALYSVSRQDLTLVDSLVFVDNNTDDDVRDILHVIDKAGIGVDVRFFTHKHGDPTKTHSWSTNEAVSHVETPWVLFTRADYLLEFDAVDQMARVATSDNQFIVGGYYDVGVDVHVCEQTEWRAVGPTALRRYGREYDHVVIDSGVWMTRKEIFDHVGGLDESQSAWGHAQTVFQHKVYQAGVEFVRVPSVLFYHPAHGYELPRDHGKAVEQLRKLGYELTDLWARYGGPDNPYRVHQ